jgi:hypothetical protein
VIWKLSDRADPATVALADNHYSRQKPGSPQFVPPGRCVVLLSTDGQSVWVSGWPFAEYVRHAWAGAWTNPMFRREGGDMVASKMIREAIAATRWRWGDPPDLGMVTFVDASKVKHKRDPGRCYRRAGFRPVGHTKGGLVALQLLPVDMPDPLVPIGGSGSLFAAVDAAGGDS